MAIVSPLPGPEPFSITPMLSSFAQGQQTRMQIEDRQRAWEQQAHDQIARVAFMADTPEKWDRMIGAYEERLGLDLSDYRDFGYRDEMMVQDPAYWQRMSHDLAERQFAFQQEQANRPEPVLPRTVYGDIQWDVNHGFISPEAGQRAMELALASDPEAPETIELIGPDGVPHVYGFNPESGMFDIDMGPAVEGSPLLDLRIGDEQPSLANTMRNDLAAAEVKLWGSFLEQEPAVASRAQDLEALALLSEVAPGGPITGRLLQMLGTGWNTAADAMSAIITRIAPTFRVEGSGSTSDIEYAGMLNSLPQLVQTVEGRKAVVTLMQNKADLDLRRADIVRQFQNEEIDEREARSQLAAINRESIVTPEYRQLVGLPAEEPPSPAGGPAEDGRPAELTAENIRATIQSAVERGESASSAIQRLAERFGVTEAQIREWANAGD